MTARSAQREQSECQSEGVGKRAGQHRRRRDECKRTRGPGAGDGPLGAHEGCERRRGERGREHGEQLDPDHRGERVVEEAVA